jgi:uncharacterized membrane protein YedE/YeeE
MRLGMALVTGLLFGLGLTLSGMSDPDKVIGFLDISGAWVPDLMFVMGGAVAITTITTPIILSRPAPIFAEAFSLPVSQIIDRKLIVGAVIFGVGWGLSGYCPGPSIVSLIYGYQTTIVFCLAMLVGMWLESRLAKSAG